MSGDDGVSGGLTFICIPVISFSLPQGQKDGEKKNGGDWNEPRQVMWLVTSFLRQLSTDAQVKWSGIIKTLL